MVLKLYGYPISTVTKRVAAVLHEKKLPFEFHLVDFMKAEHKAPEYKAKQPFGQIPYLDDDGFIVYESRAICRYLDEKYPEHGTKLIPSDVHQRALFEQAVSVEICHFDPVASPIAFEMVYKEKFFGSKPDMAKVEERTATLAANLDVYEQILTKQKYIGGDSLTLADFFHLPYGSLLPEAQCHLMQERPHVAKWFDEVQNRASWQAVKDGVSSRA